MIPELNLTPDEYVILVIPLEEYRPTSFHVFGNWKGGYLSSDSWRRSTAIVKVSDEGEYVRAETASGSSYLLHKSEPPVTGENGWIIANLEEKLGVSTITLGDLVEVFTDVVEDFTDV